MSVQFAVNTQHMNRTTSVPQGSGATMCAWLKVTSYADWGNPLAISAGGANFLGVEWDSGGNVYFHSNTNTGYQSTTFSTGSYTGWMFVAFVASSSGLQGYYHKAGGSWTVATNLTDSQSNRGTLTDLGLAWEPAFGDSANGTVRMRCMRVWNTTLTQTELQAERDSATPVKTSNLTFNNNGTAASTVGTDSTSTGNMTVAGTPTDQSDEPPIAVSLTLPSPLAIASTLNAPELSAGSGSTTLTLPSPLSISSSLNAPSVTAGGVSLSPPALSIGSALFAPTLSEGANLSLPGALSISASLFAPTVQAGGVSLTLPSPLAISSSLFAPSLTTPASLALPSALSIASTLNAPTAIFKASTLHWKPSENGRYFVDDYGTPVLLHGDSGWCSIDQLNQTEAQQYLTDLYSRHFNTCVIAAPNSAFTTTPPENAFGELPWTGTAFQTSLNADYWDHVLWFMQQANLRGIVPLFNPAYLGINNTEGWQDQVAAASNAQMQQYGVDVGTYLADVDYVIVAYGDNGGDPTTRARLAAMLTGLLSVGKPRLVSFHNGPDSPSWETSATDTTTWHLSYIYAEAGGGYTHVQVREGYQDSAKPVVMFESRYENPGVVNEERVRRQAWGAMAYGACGHNYGHELLWRFETGWAAYLDDTVRTQMQHLHAFFNARRWWLLEPDFNATSTFVTAGRGTEASTGFVPGAVASDGSWGFAYVPNGSGPITIDRTELSATFTARWFNPRTGAYTAIGTSPNTGTEQFTRPDANDWVLVLDVAPPAELGLPAPLSIATTLNAPSISANASLSLPLQQINSALNAPQLQAGGVNLSVPLLQADITVQAPAVSAGGVALTLPSALAIASALQAPSMQAGPVSLSLPLQAIASQLFAPTLQAGGVSLVLPLQQIAAALYEPILTEGGVVLQLPAALSMGASLLPPSVQADVNLSLPAALALASQLFAPAELDEGGISLTLPLQQLAAALLSPSVGAGPVELNPPALALAIALFAPAFSDRSAAGPILTYPELAIADPIVAYPKLEAL